MEDFFGRYFLACVVMVAAICQIFSIGIDMKIADESPPYISTCSDSIYANIHQREVDVQTFVSGSTPDGFSPHATVINTSGNVVSQCLNHCDNNSRIMVVLVPLSP